LLYFTFGYRKLLCDLSEAVSHGTDINNSDVEEMSATSNDSDSEGMSMSGDNEEQPAVV